MSKILNSCKIQYKIMIRNKVNISLIFLALIYNFYLFYNYLFNYHAPGEALVKSSFSVQGGILAFIMIGIQLDRSEKRNNIYEVLQTIHESLINKILGKFIFIITLDLCQYSGHRKFNYLRSYI